MTTPLLQLNRIEHRWPNAQTDLLRINHFELKAGESVFLHGPSGSGKSTLLNIITGIQKPTHGDVFLSGQLLWQMPNAKRDQIRATQMGVITQTLNLLPYLSIRENLALMCNFAHKPLDISWQHHLLEKLNLSHVINQKSQTLSIGQRQRAAIARALIHKPQLIIADEPTSALDDDNTHAFYELLLNECQTHNIGVLLVSHDLRWQRFFNKQLALNDLQEVC